jgi:hypothetical protein
MSQPSACRPGISPCGYTEQAGSTTHPKPAHPQHWLSARTCYTLLYVPLWRPHDGCLCWWTKVDLNQWAFFILILE